MYDIDSSLARLADSRIHPKLASLDVAVLGAVARQAMNPPLNGSVFGAAATMALLLGIATSAYSGAPAKASTISPLIAYSALAPSALLGTHK